MGVLNAVSASQSSQGEGKGAPATPQDLAQHEVLRLKAPGLRPRTWRLFNAARQDDPLDAALPSRKFLPERTRVFLEYLTERTRIEVNSAVQACQNC